MAERTILATCGGWTPSTWHGIDFSPLQRYAVELAGVEGRRARVAIIGTAQGDPRPSESDELAAAARAGVDAFHIRLFGRNFPDLDEALADVDVVWVNGGSVVNLLAVWRAHGLDQVLRRAWERGVVLAGVSAGAICWHAGGPTSSFGGDTINVVDDALGFVPTSIAVHYDSQPGRRPAFHAAIADGAIPGGYAVDEGVGIVYRGTEPTQFVAESDGSAYRVVAEDGRAVETSIAPRRL
ncbi:peptidase E [Microbacterium indicum]|uniref:Type 1 glutamine amidotransferase-like domain-containing protein n=1 Tax=Microbacterium indicum TaxID=358100 RepID=UPI00041B653B|nr:peptidase E [Microbacterium indicum]